MALQETFELSDGTGFSTYGTTWRFQTWTTESAYSATDVALYGFKYGSPGDITVSIREVDGEGKPTGDDLCGVTVDESEISDFPTRAWYTFTFDTPYALSDATQYAIVIRAIGGSAANYYAPFGYGSSGYAGGGSGSGDGSTWSDINTANDMDFRTYETLLINVRGVWLGSDGSFLVATAETGVFLSTDLGDNWTRKTPDDVEDTDWVKGICSDDGTYIIVVSSANAIYRSANSGTAWAAITPAGGDTFSVNDLATSDDGQFMVVVGENSTDATESCYISTDYGVTWTAKKPVAASIEWTECDISNDGAIIAVSTSGYFYISLDSGATWLEQGMASFAEVWEGLSVSGDGTTGLIANTNDNNEFFIGINTELYSEATWAESALTSAGRALLDDASAADQASTIGVGTGDSPTFVGTTLTGLTASRLLATDADKALTSLASPLIVAEGGTGLSTITDHGILLGSGTDAIMPLGVASDGQLPIGSTDADPVLAALTGTANQIVVTNAAGSITLSTPQDIHTGATPTFAGLTLTNAAVIGSDSAVFQPNTDSTTFFQILDADGGTPILNVDTTNARLGINCIPEVGIDVVGERLRLQGKGSSPTSGAGMEIFYDSSGYANLQVYDRNTSQYKEFRFNALHTTFKSSGGNIDVDFLADGNVYFVNSIGIGETSPETITEWTHATPYLTLHNSTHEDTDGGRESRLNFKGEQSGGEETTLARIEVSHDGVVDDEKGKIIISINDGDDTNTPTQALEIGSDLLATFAGSIVSANYTAANLLTACATNAGALDFSAASKTLTVEDNATVSQDYSSDASPQFTGIELGHASDTTITRVSAGVIAVEGTNVMLVGDAPTAHTIASHSDTTATGANLNTLVGGGDVGALHTHAAAYQPLDAELTSLAALSYAAASFVKMTGANTFALRTIGETADDLEATIDHDNLANGGAHDYAYISGNDGATGITAAELEELSDGSETTLHSHAAGADAEKVKVDVGATSDYIGAASNDGVLRTTTGLSYADGGNYVTLGLSHLGIESLTDPDTDRCLFWDDSESAIKWLTVIQGVQIYETKLQFDVNSLTEDTTPATNDYVVTFDVDHGVAGYEHKKVLISNLPRGYFGYIKLSDTQAQNTGGGTFTSGAWRTRVLNTEDSDTNNDCTLNANQITLAAGTYECHISCPAFRVNRHQARLYNTTGAATILVGTSEVAVGGSDFSATRSFIVGRFTIAASQALEVQHQCQTTRADNGLGVGSNFTSEIYTIAEFWRVS